MRQKTRRIVLLGLLGTAIMFVAAPMPAFAHKPSHPVVVDEDFEDGVADGFFTGTGGLFNPGAQLGTVIDDGTGNNVYQMREADQNQAFVSPEALIDFDLTFDATFPPSPFAQGLVGILFRADPDGVEGYFMDSETLIVRSASGDEIIGEAEGPLPTAGNHEVRLRAIGDRIEMFLDGRRLLSVTDSTYRSGHVGLVEVSGGTIQVDNIVLRRKPLDIEAEADLDGSQEVPSVTTDMTGEVEVEIEEGEMEFELEVEDNSNDIFAAHIHCAPPGSNGPAGITLFVGSFTGEEGTLAEGTITAPDAGNGCGWDSLAAVAADIVSGNTYVNVHTTAASGGVPSGEIRGNVIGDNDD